MKNFSITLIIFLCLLLCWELFSRFNENFIFILPSPLQVLARLWDRADRFWFHSLITLQEMLFGFLLAFLVAFPLALIMDLYKSASSILQPLFIVIQCIPMFTLAPIMIVWFGWSSAAIIVPTALMIFFPLTINVYQGLRSTPEDLLNFFRVNQATPWQIFYKLKLPGALPHIFGGFRLATAIAGIAAVAGEWAGAQNGLGILMIESRRDTDLETNFAALLCLTLISMLLYSFAVFGEYVVTHRKAIGVISSIRLRGRTVEMFKTLLMICLLIICPMLISFAFNRPVDAFDPVTITLDWLPNANHIPLYTGIEKGFFARQGIDLKIKKLHDSGNAVSYLTSGESDLALHYMPNTIRMCHKGAKLKTVGILIGEPLNSIVYRKNLLIKTPSDLSGKKIGHSSSGKECAFLRAMLGQKNIDPASLSRLGPDLIPFFGSSQVDAIYGVYWNIETEHLRSLGIETEYFKLSEFGVPHYYELIVLARMDSDQAQPDFIQRFQRALQQSINYSKLHFEEAFKIYTEVQKDQSVKTRKWTWESWKLTLPTFVDCQAISEEVWQTFEAWLKENQLL
jgi:ABC-type nitrate/sulfonate/bicarbonate transport system permease component/ABC-type nitrate/sulfonate/bicarbonate transport system substrate-binding protein